MVGSKLFFIQFNIKNMCCKGLGKKTVNGHIFFLITFSVSQRAFVVFFDINWRNSNRNFPFFFFLFKKFFSFTEIIKKLFSKKETSDW